MAAKISACAASIMLLAASYPAFAASGPLAEGFGRDDWLGKLHVVGAVVGLVLLVTAILITLIIRSEDPSREKPDE